MMSGPRKINSHGFPPCSAVVFIMDKHAGAILNGRGRRDCFSSNLAHTNKSGPAGMTMGQRASPTVHLAVAAYGL